MTLYCIFDSASEYLQNFIQERVLSLFCFNLIISLWSKDYCCIKTITTHAPFVYKRYIYKHSINIFSSSLYSKWAPASVRTGVSIMVLSRTLDSWWTIAHNIFICFFFFFPLQSSSQQEIYWAANLRSSNWLRKNLNEFLNIQLKSIVTLFILGPRQIEIETINGSTSFWKKESWQLHSKHHIHTLTYTHVYTHMDTLTHTHLPVIYSEGLHD